MFFILFPRHLCQSKPCSPPARCPPLLSDHNNKEINGAKTIPTSSAELKEKLIAEDDEEVPFGAAGLAEVDAEVVAPVAEDVVLDMAVADPEVAVPLADEVAEDEVEDEVEDDVVEPDVPFPLA